MTTTAQNPFRGLDRTLNDPYHQALAVVPNDANDLVNACRGLIVNGAGTVKVTLLDDTVPVTLTLQAGIDYRLMISRVWATGTTATGIVALY